MDSIPSPAPIICIRNLKPLLCCTNNVFCTYIIFFAKLATFANHLLRFQCHIFYQKINTQIIFLDGCLPAV